MELTTGVKSVLERWLGKKQLVNYNQIRHRLPERLFFDMRQVGDSKLAQISLFSRFTNNHLFVGAPRDTSLSPSLLRHWAKEQND